MSGIAGQSGLAKGLGEKGVVPAVENPETTSYVDTAQKVVATGYEKACDGVVYVKATAESAKKVVHEAIGTAKQSASVTVEYAKKKAETGAKVVNEVKAAGVAAKDSAVGVIQSVKGKVATGTKVVTDARAAVEGKVAVVRSSVDERKARSIAWMKGDCRSTRAETVIVSAASYGISTGIRAARWGLNLVGLTGFVADKVHWVAEKTRSTLGSSARVQAAKGLVEETWPYRLGTRVVTSVTDQVQGTLTGSA